MFSWMSETSSPLSSVVVSSPASASVETLGLSTIAMSGSLPAAAVVRSLTVSPVLPALRLIVMPMSAAQASMALAQSEAASRSGYGSHRVYSVEPDESLSLRSEEHTSELQSRENLVCRLLLEKKKDHKSR